MAQNESHAFPGIENQEDCMLHCADARKLQIVSIYRSVSIAVTDVFLYNFDKPNFFVDITPLVADKLKLLSFHKSQIDIVAAEKSVRGWNRVLGKKIGVAYAEGFIHIDLGKR